MDLPLVYEEFENNESILQVNYDWLGNIEKIFVYSPFTNGKVLVDLEAFILRNPSRYNYLQNKILESLGTEVKTYV